MASIAITSTPGGENARATFSWRPSMWNRTLPDWHHLHGDNDIDQMHTLFPKNVLHNYDISVHRQVGMFLNGVACLMKVRPLFKREFPCILMTWHTGRARMWSHRCKQTDSRWFQGRNMCFWWMWSTISGKLSLIILSNCLIHEIFNHTPPACYFQQLAGSCHSLWITSRLAGHALDWWRMYVRWKCIFFTYW